MRYLPFAACAVIIGLILVGCGSSSKTAAAPPVPGGAVATAPSSAPAYCRVLTESNPLVGVGKALDKLAANPHDHSAAVAIRSASDALLRAAKRAPHGQRVALTSAANTVRAIADHGFGEAPKAQRALVRAGHLLEHSCAFPVD
jgi:hypothetical protein